MAKHGIFGLTIADLRNLLATHESSLKELQSKKKVLQREMDELDSQIAKIHGNAGKRRGRPPKNAAAGTSQGGTTSGGAGRRAGGRRAKNENSLVATLETVLKEGGKAMSIGDIVDGVQNAGYRSSSPNFRSIVNQTLIKEKKRFASAGRGLYQVKA